GRRTTPDPPRQGVSLPFSPFHIAAELRARIGNMRSHRRFGTTQSLGYFVRRQSLDIAQYERRPLPGAKQSEAVRQIFMVFAPQDDLLRAFAGGLRRHIQFTILDPAM